MIIDIETDWKLPTQGIKPHTISVLKSRSVGKSVTQVLYFWNEFYKNELAVGFSMDKPHYQHFVRLYNRKKRQRFSDLKAAGYACVKLPDGWIKQRTWCEKNLKPGAWVNGHNYFWFAYDEDAVLFKMHWL